MTEEEHRAYQRVISSMSTKVRARYIGRMEVVKVLQAHTDDMRFNKMPIEAVRVVKAVAEYQRELAELMWADAYKRMTDKEGGKA